MNKQRPNAPVNGVIRKGSAGRTRSDDVFVEQTPSLTNANSLSPS